MRSASRFPGRRLPDFGALTATTGFLLDMLFAQQIPVESPGRRQATLDAARTQPFAVTSGGKRHARVRYRDVSSHARH